MPGFLFVAEPVKHQMNTNWTFSLTSVVTILLFKVLIDLDSIFEEKNRDLDSNVNFS